MWSALVQRVEPISAFAWVDKIEIVGLDTEKGLCTVRPRRGQREIAGFVSPRLCDRLAAELTKLVQRPCRIELVGADPPQPARGDRHTAPNNDSGGAGPRRAALDLPLVKDVLDAFPNAVMLDARKEPGAEPQDTTTQGA